MVESGDEAGEGGGEAEAEEGEEGAGSTSEGSTPLVEPSSFGKTRPRSAAGARLDVHERMELEARARQEETRQAQQVARRTAARNYADKVRELSLSKALPRTKPEAGPGPDAALPEARVAGRGARGAPPQQNPAVGPEALQGGPRVVR